MMSKTGYLGPEGSYSQLAAQNIRRGTPVAYPSFPALFGALKRDEVSGIVLPVENSLNGGVMQNLDLLQNAEGVLAVGEIRVRIEHRLVTIKGAPYGGITRVYSHPQALAQCAKFLHEKLPRAALVPTSSTSACLGMINCPSDAGIIGLQNIDKKYELSPCAISDEKLNYTQFLYVVKHSPQDIPSGEKVFLSITCAHRPGALIQALSAFADEGINMTRIESRPIKERMGEYRFFIEVEGDYSSPAVQSALSRLHAACSSVKILGSYAHSE